MSDLYLTQAFAKALDMSDEQEEIIEIDPEKMSGTPVFRGTRVPIQNFFDYLEGGHSLKVFLDHFPTVSHDQAVGIIELCKVKLLGESEVAT